MKIKTINLYTFDELAEDAKEKARDWWRTSLDSSDFDAVTEDAVRMAELLGIEIDRRSWTNSYGYTGSEPRIYWSGFYSQGDGACFVGHYGYKKGAPAAIIAETSAGREDASDGDRELLRIARALQEIQKKNFYQLTARTEHRGHYNHSGCMSVDVRRQDDREPTADAEDEITQLMRDFADWIYSQLEAENDYLYSDEHVDESIRINEYTFTKDGERED